MGRRGRFLSGGERVRRGGERKGAGERRAGLLREGGAFDTRRRFLRGRGVPFKGSGGMSGVRLIFSRRGRFLRGADVIGVGYVFGNAGMFFQGRGYI